MDNTNIEQHSDTEVTREMANKDFPFEVTVKHKDLPEEFTFYVSNESILGGDMHGIIVAAYQGQLPHILTIWANYIYSENKSSQCENPNVKTCICLKK